MRIHYYKSKADADSHKETIEEVVTVSGFRTMQGKCTVEFMRKDGTEEEIPFENFITVVEG